MHYANVAIRFLLAIIALILWLVQSPIIFLLNEPFKAAEYLSVYFVLATFILPIFFNLCPYYGIEMNFVT